MPSPMKHSKKGAGTLAQRIDFLFHSVYPAGRGPYELEEICRGIEEQSGITVSQPYLSQLHRGTRTNPSKNHLEAIARFFDVPIEYFFESTQSQELADNLATVEAIKGAGVQNVALRAAALSPAGREAIIRIIDEITAASTPPPPIPRRRRDTDSNNDNDNKNNDKDKDNKDNKDTDSSPVSDAADISTT